MVCQAWLYGCRSKQSHCWVTVTLFTPLPYRCLKYEWASGSQQLKWTKLALGVRFLWVNCEEQLSTDILRLTSAADNVSCYTQYCMLPHKDQRRRSRPAHLEILYSKPPNIPTSWGVKKIPWILGEVLVAYTIMCVIMLTSCTKRQGI